jgi:hypothetical protein
MGRNSNWAVGVAMAAGTALAAGCATNKNTSAGDEGVAVSLNQLSAPARATVERESAGGYIGKITKETERGRVVYDVEGNVGGKHTEWLVADSDGAVLGRETVVGWGEVPAPVRAAAEAYFDKGGSLVAYKGVEYGDTTYEVVGTKNGKRAEKTWDPMGKPEAEGR